MTCLPLHLLSKPLIKTITDLSSLETQHYCFQQRTLSWAANHSYLRLNYGLCGSQTFGILQPWTAAHKTWECCPSEWLDLLRGRGMLCLGSRLPIYHADCCGFVGTWMNLHLAVFSDSFSQYGCWEQLRLRVYCLLASWLLPQLELWATCQFQTASIWAYLKSYLSAQSAWSPYVDC